MLYRSPRILVIDDEPPITDTLAKILELQGYEVATAYSGEEAVRTACLFQPDFLLSDILMGGMNGIDAAIEILKFIPHCKVLFISGHASYRDLQADGGGRGQEFEVLAKPVHPTELLRKISRVLAA
ncbi:MAG: response regulator [Acidobacteria bacterium]|nr:MAG: response regulator [Acidobacteriota bacterium]